MALSLFVYLAGITGAAFAADWRELRHQAFLAVERGDYPVAADYFRQCVPLSTNEFEKGVTANDLGIVLHHSGHDSEAKPHLEKAVAIWHANTGSAARLAQSSEALAMVDRALGDYAAAEGVLREALKTPPADDENIATILNELGDVLREMGSSAEATAILERALALKGVSIRRRVDTNLALADLDRGARRWTSSIDRWNYAAQTARENHWPSLEASALRGLGTTYVEHDELARAEPVLRRALEQFETIHAPRHQVATTLSCLAQMYIAQGKYAMADEELLKAIDLTEKSLGPTHPQVAILLEMRGEAAGGRGEIDEARGYYARAHAIMAGHFGERSGIAAAVLASLGLVEQRAKQNGNAAADFERALEVLDAQGPDSEPLRSIVHQRYAEVCKALHKKPAVSDGFRAQSFRAVNAH
jgi:tetratricopeptide (TPR) repeat protein